MTRQEREGRSHTRDVVLGLSIILAGAPAAWWSVGFAVAQLDLVGRGFGWWS